MKNYLKTLIKIKKRKIRTILSVLNLFRVSLLFLPLFLIFATSVPYFFHYMSWLHLMNSQLMMILMPNRLCNLKTKERKKVARKQKRRLNQIFIQIGVIVIMNPNLKNFKKFWINILKISILNFSKINKKKMKIFNGQGHFSTN